MIYKNKILSKYIIILSLAITLNNLYFERPIYSEDTINGNILILYDDYKQYGEEQNILNYITKLALATGKKVEIFRLGDYKGEDILKYDGLFILCNKDNSLNEDIKKNILKYNKSIYWFGKNFRKFIEQNNIPNVKYEKILKNVQGIKYTSESKDIYLKKLNKTYDIPIFTSNNTNENTKEEKIKVYNDNDSINLITKINNINYIPIVEFNNYIYRYTYNKIYEDFRNEEITRNNNYFYLDEVTPFNDLNLLVEQIDCLKENGIPFFIQVTPVFENENLKAMQRFSEILRYAQSNGGQVVLSFPSLKNIYIDANVINEKMKNGFENYLNYLIYPVSINASEYWLYRNDLKILLENMNTLFLENNSDVGILDFSMYSINPYERIIEKIEFDDNNLYIKGLYNNVAIKVSSKLNIDEFRNKLNYFNNKSISFKSTYDVNLNIKLNNMNVKSNKDGILLNNKDVTQARFINNEEFRHNINTQDNLSSNIDLTESNKIIEFIISIIIVFFIIILLISIKIDRNKFLKR